VLKSGLYNVIAGTIRLSIAVLTIPILIRLIGLEEYGLWSLAYAIIGVVALAEAGLAMSTTVFVSRDLAMNDTESLSETLTVTISAMLLLATLAASALWVNAPALASLFPALGELQRQQLIESMGAVAVLVWVRLVQQTLVGIEQAHQRYDWLNALNTIQLIISTLGMFGVVWLGGRTVELMQWQAIVAVVGFSIHTRIIYFLVHPLKLHLVWSYKKGSLIAKYSLLTWLSTLGGTIFSRGDRLIVGAILGSTNLGLYAAITDITNSINMISALPVQPIIPTLSRLIASKNYEQKVIRQKFKLATQICAVVALSFGAMLLALTPLVFQTILPGNYSRENVLLFQIATVIYSIHSTNAVGYYTLFAVDSVSLLMLGMLGGGTLSILLVFFGSSSFGLIGAVCGNIGFFGTLILPIFAINKLKIYFRELIQWIRVPFLWFLAASTTNIVLVSRDIALLNMISISLIQTVGILTWLALQHKMIVFNALQRIKSCKNLE